ncbi:MAG TPA: hypothetical protein VGD67_28875 [Pseudonocardiaceae bacterium]
MRRTITIVALVMAAAAVGAVGVAAAVPASVSTTPYCGITWGSQPKELTPGSTAELEGIRTGRHDCFDRLVIDVRDGDIAGYTVSYVDQITMDGSGAPVAVRGGARLQVVARVPTPTMDSIFLPNGELADVTGYQTFRHVAWAGSFEGQTTIGLGVRARLPFRVLLLDGPGTGSRMVVDVAHRW